MWVRGEEAPLALEGVSTRIPRSHSQLGLCGLGLKKDRMSGVGGKARLALWLGGAQVLPHPSPRNPQVQAPVILTTPSSLPFFRGPDL